MVEISIEKMAKNVAESALDTILYQGKSIREWMQIICEADYVGKWIPVNERLPEDGKTVIASTKYNIIYPETRFTKEYGWEWAYESGADYWRELEDVLAWMPLPESYKAESEESNG